MTEVTLEQRLQRMEALESIRLLKHRYLNACDLKEEKTIRNWCKGRNRFLVLAFESLSEQGSVQ